jgi:hypothetical protein
MKHLFNLLLFFAMCLLVYLVFRNQGVIEGLENAGQSTTSNATGIGGGSSDYVTRLTDAVTKKTDILLVSKYRTEYEKAIIKADDLVDVLMLEQVLSINTKSPDIATFEKIATLSQAKDGLNKVMKALDSAKTTDGSSWL